SAVVNEKIYVVGGFDTSSHVEIFDPATNSWSVGAPMPTQLHRLTASAIGKKIYAVGDYQKWNGSLLEIYDVDSDRWSYGASMSAARESPAAIVIKDKLDDIGDASTGGGIAQTSVDICDPG